MTQIATTPEQSNVLLYSGLDKSTADMYYDNLTGNELRVGNTNMHDTTSAWSLQALLDVMPKTIRGASVTYNLRIQYDYSHPMMYYVITEGERKGRLLRFGNRCTPDAKDVFDAAVQLICWMLRDGVL